MFVPGVFPQRRLSASLCSGHDEAMIIIAGNITGDVKLPVDRSQETLVMNQFRVVK